MLAGASYADDARRSSATTSPRAAEPPERLYADSVLSGREDLNLRPFGPEPNALPGCATPRRVRGVHAKITVGSQWRSAPDRRSAPDLANGSAGTRRRRRTAPA